MSARIVGKGKIRVDARKAMAKLREHLLVDQHAFVLELVRAAILGGATAIDVAYDADDFVVTFDARPPPSEELPRLFEHLLDDQPDPAVRYLRLLALAMNAALGLDPAWIALTVSEGGARARVRWTPKLVAAVEREEAALPEVEDAEEDAEMPMPPRGVRLHLRRKIGWTVVRRAATGHAPAEIGLLAQACHDLPIPLRIMGNPIATTPRAPPIASVPFVLPGATSAVLDVLPALGESARVWWSEAGVLLAATSLSFGRHFPVAEVLDAWLPIRIRVNAPDLPTNASRSAVREDAPIVASAGRIAASALGDAIAALAAHRFGRGEVPTNVQLFEATEAQIEDALGAMLCVVDAAARAGAHLPESAQILLDLPMFSDALGRAFSRRALPQVGAIRVWPANEDVPEEIAQWASMFVKPRGRVADRALTAFARDDTLDLVRRARRGAERLKRLRAQAQGAPALREGVAWMVRRKIEVHEGLCAGLVGEVGIPADLLVYGRDVAIRVLIERRPFVALELPERVVPLPCEMAIAWPDHIVPAFAYEGVERNEAFARAVAHVVREAIACVAELALTREREGAPLSANERVAVRTAIGTLVQPPEGLGASLDDFPALRSAIAWPTTDGGAKPLSALASGAVARGGLCVASSAGRAPDGRSVALALRHEVEWLRRALGAHVPIVQYDRALVPTTTPRPPAGSVCAEFAALVDRAASQASAPILFHHEDRVRWAVTLGSSEVCWFHAGFVFPRAPMGGGFGGVLIAIEDDGLLPQPEWNGAISVTDTTVLLRAERAFIETLAAALDRDPASRARLWSALPRDGSPALFRFTEDPRAISPALRSYLLARAALARREAAANRSEQEAAIADRIEALPLFNVVDTNGVLSPASLAQIAAAHPAPQPLPFISVPPTFRPVLFRPVIVRDPQTAMALGVWSQGRTRDAAADLSRHEAASRHALQRHALRERPAVDPRDPGVACDAEGPRVYLPPHPPLDLAGVAAGLPKRGIALAGASIDILMDDRLVETITPKELPIPVIARAAVTSPADLDSYRTLSSIGRKNVAARVLAAAVELALAILEHAARPPDSQNPAGSSAFLFNDARAISLVAALIRLPNADARVRGLLTSGGLRWPTVHGDPAPWSALARTEQSPEPAGGDAAPKGAPTAEIWIGASRFAKWHAPEGPPTDLDTSILHVPAGELGDALAGLLEGLGCKPRSVDAALSALQRSRSAGDLDRPRFEGAPPHPMLRQPISALDRGGEGEIEIVAGGEPQAQIVALSGEHANHKLALPFPARAIVYVDVLSPKAIGGAVERTERAAMRLLIGLGAHTAELPAFVRAHLRLVLCSALAREKKIGGAIAEAPVFEDVDGRCWSLEQIRKIAAEGSEKNTVAWSCTYDPPPYPAARHDDRVLALTQAEHLAIGREIRILNVTEWMRRDLEAERRRAATPLQDFSIPPDVRPRTFFVTSIAEEGLRGEIGFLRTWATEPRGVAILIEGRPVTTIEDGPGWPLAGVIDVTWARPNRWFDGLLPADEIKLRSRIRALANAALRKMLLEQLDPSEAIVATRWIDETVAGPPHSTGIAIVGLIVAPHPWPVEPRVRVLLAGQTAPVDRTLALPSRGQRGTLPCGGTVLVCAEPSSWSADHEQIFATAILRNLAAAIAPRLREMEEAHGTNAELESYAWDLALVGAAMDHRPTALATSGGRIDATSIRTELLHRGAVWLSDKAGDIDGDFPEIEGAPGFLIRDGGSPLVRVLRARLAPSALRTLGGTAKERTSSAPARAGAPALPHAPPSGDRGSSALAATVVAPEPAAPESGRSWWRTLTERALDLWHRVPPPAASITGIGVAIEQALGLLRFTGDPVNAVQESAGGPLVQYDPRRREVRIHVEHHLLAVNLHQSPALARQATLAVLAAALHAINEAVVPITDEDEVRALFEMLRQLETIDSAPGAAPGEP